MAISFVLVTVSFLFAGNVLCTRQGICDSAAQSSLAEATDRTEFANARRELIPENADRKTVLSMKYGECQFASIAAAWCECLHEFNAESKGRFVGFLEAKLDEPCPEWWIDALMDAVKHDKRVLRFPNWKQTQQPPTVASWRVTSVSDSEVTLCLLELEIKVSKQDLVHALKLEDIVPIVASPIDDSRSIIAIPDALGGIGYPHMFPIKCIDIKRGCPVCC